MWRLLALVALLITMSLSAWAGTRVVIGESQVGYCQTVFGASKVYVRNDPNLKPTPIGGVTPHRQVRTNRSRRTTRTASKRHYRQPKRTAVTRPTSRAASRAVVSPPVRSYDPVVRNALYDLKRGQSAIQASLKDLKAGQEEIRQQQENDRKDLTEAVKALTVVVNRMTPTDVGKPIPVKVDRYWSLKNFLKRNWVWIILLLVLVGLIAWASKPERRQVVVEKWRSRRRKELDVDEEVH